MKYTAMIVGDRDLSLGLPFLVDAAKESNLKLLSANLVDTAGKPLFDGHLVFKDGSLKICAVALSPDSSHGAAVARQDSAEAAKRELQAVAQEGCGVKLLLANLPRQELEDVLKKVPGFDLAASAHDGWQAEPQTVAGVPTIYCGQRGRTVTRVDIVRNEGGGAFTDLGAIGRDVEDLQHFDKQISDLQTQLGKAATPQLADNFKARLQTLEKIRADKAKTLSAIDGQPLRSFRAKYFTLDTSVADNPDLKKVADAYAAKYPDVAPAAPHPVVGPRPPGAPGLPGRPPFPGRPPLVPAPPQRPPPPAAAAPGGKKA
jgi:2',3'-cyclic-nucleotide 2'-phosphodiesterase (5'-nucleotidase family)